MKMRKNALASTVAAGLIAGAGATVSSNAVAYEPGVSAGVEISNMYLWRGFDLGAPNAIPMIAGSLDLDSGAGFYAGTWAASGDNEAGTELDLYAGYAMDLTDDIAIDVGAVTYMYPSTDPDDEEFGDFGDLSEVYLGISGYGFGLDYYNNIAGASGYSYVNASYGYGPFGVAVGQHLDGFDDATHLDLSFAVTDEFSLTASTIIDSDDDDTYRSTALVQVLYTKSFDF